MDDALADTVINAVIDSDTAINAGHTVIDINTIINADTVRGQLHHLPLALHAVTSTMGPHASHICMHAMLASGDIDLVLAMNAGTNINADISPPDAAR